MSALETWHTSDTWRAELKDDDTPMYRRARLLDRETDRHPILDALLDLALTQMMMTCDGSTASLAAKVSGGGHHDSQAPRSGLAEDVERLARRYVEARTHRQRFAVIKEAQEAAVRLRYAPKCDPSLVRGTREWRQMIASDPRPRRIVAVRYQVSSKTITACRKEFGL